jgi:gallate dioxygenase
MAQLIGALATSHTPTIGFALDAGKHDDPVWKPIFKAFEPMRAWLNEKKPDALIVIYNDHVTSFFFDHYSAFALGVGDSYPPADEGGGARRIPALAGHAALARHIGRSLTHDEFDLSFFQHKALDHGCSSPLSMLYPGVAQWPTPIVPLQIGVLQSPSPNARRCFKLGQALRRAIDSYPEELRVAIVATGGLSHQVHGERAGFNNPDWDTEFMDLLQSNPGALLDLTLADYAIRGGYEGAEVIMWLVMRGAMDEEIHCLHRSYTLPSMTGIATAIYEPAHSPAELPAQQQPARLHREAMARELSGLEQIAGTYPFTLEASSRTFRFNRYLQQMTVPQHRALFLSDPESSFEQAHLSEEEKQLIRERNWRAMIHYGAIFFGLEKLAAVLGLSNLHVYAAMRGESLEEFLKTRNAPSAIYSVSGSGKL